MPAVLHPTAMPNNPCNVHEPTCSVSNEDKNPESNPTKSYVHCSDPGYDDSFVINTTSPRTNDTGNSSATDGDDPPKPSRSKAAVKSAARRARKKAAKCEAANSSPTGASISGIDTLSSPINAAIKKGSVVNKNRILGQIGSTDSTMTPSEGPAEPPTKKWLIRKKQRKNDRKREKKALKAQAQAQQFAAHAPTTSPSDFAIPASSSKSPPVVQSLVSSNDNGKASDGHKGCSLPSTPFTFEHSRSPSPAEMSPSPDEATRLPLALDVHNEEPEFHGTYTLDDFEDNIGDWSEEPMDWKPALKSSRNSSHATSLASSPASDDADKSLDVVTENPNNAVNVVDTVGGINHVYFFIKPEAEKQPEARLQDLVDTIDDMRDASIYPIDVTEDITMESRLPVIGEEDTAGDPVSACDVQPLEISAKADERSSESEDAADIGDEEQFFEASFGTEATTHGDVAATEKMSGPPTNLADATCVDKACAAVPDITVTDESAVPTCEPPETADVAMETEASSLVANKSEPADEATFSAVVVIDGPRTPPSSTNSTPDTSMFLRLSPEIPPKFPKTEEHPALVDLGNGIYSRGGRYFMEITPAMVDTMVRATAETG